MFIIENMITKKENNTEISKKFTRQVVYVIDGKESQNIPMKNQRVIFSFYRKNRSWTAEGYETKIVSLGAIKVPKKYEVSKINFESSLSISKTELSKLKRKNIDSNGNIKAIKVFPQMNFKIKIVEYLKLKKD